MRAFSFVILSEARAERREASASRRTPMIRTKRYYVYILASLSGTLYIGITDNLERRMVEHKEGPNSGF